MLYISTTVTTGLACLNMPLAVDNKILFYWSLAIGRPSMNHSRWQNPHARTSPRTARDILPPYQLGHQTRTRGKIGYIHSKTTLQYSIIYQLLRQCKTRQFMPWQHPKKKVRCIREHRMELKMRCVCTTRDSLFGQGEKQEIPFVSLPQRGSQASMSSTVYPMLLNHVRSR